MLRAWHCDSICLACVRQALHTAMSDIHESLDQLRYYRQAIFRRPPGSQAQ